MQYRFQFIHEMITARPTDPSVPKRSLSARSARRPCIVSVRPFSDDIGNITGGLAVTGPGDSCTEISQASSPIGNGASLNPTKYKSLTTASAKGRGGYINSSDGECYRGAATSTTPHDGENADQLDDVPATLGPMATKEARGRDEEATPGVFGRDGLLATPDVKILLILACNAQVSVV